MNWKIESRPIDVYELGPNDTQQKYIVYVLDDFGRPIEAEEAYGIEDRTRKTRLFTAKYGKYIVKIEHQ